MAAISATLGGTASNGSATSTLAFSAANISGGQDILVAIALADTTKTVTGIADTALNTFAMRSAVNGTGVRTEIWEAQAVIGNVADVITITFSGATLAAAAFEEYAGVPAQGSPIFPSTPDYAPHNMSDNTTPAPYVVTVSSNYSGRIGASAFNGDYTGGEGAEWLGQNNGTDYLSIDLGTARTVTGYSITITNSTPYGANRAPKTWTFRGSTDNFSSFTVLDTQASQIGWSQGEKRTFVNSVTGSFRYYRINITANQGADPQFTCILEMNFWGGSPSSLTPQNTSTNTGSSAFPQTALALQEQGTWPAAALGFVCNSGDTVAALSGATVRQSVVPALTSVGIALVDFLGGFQAGVATLSARISTSRNWAAAGVNLRSDGAALFAIHPQAILTPMSSAGSGSRHQIMRAPAQAPSSGPSVVGWTY